MIKLWKTERVTEQQDILRCDNPECKQMFTLKAYFPGDDNSDAQFFAQVSCYFCPYCGQKNEVFA